MLENILRCESYALAMSPGFFQFYALTGVLRAFEDFQCLQVTHVSGASAGALVGGFLASGMPPSRMIEKVLKFKRQDIWDVGGIGGLLKGQLFQKALENELDIRNIEECMIPLGVTAWEIFGFKTKLITSGDLATAIRASCTFPFLFQPALVDGTLCIDGGVFDTSGMMALPGVPPSNLIVNIVCGTPLMGHYKLPEKYKDSRLLTLVMKNIPGVSPFSMEDRGPLAYKTARLATHNALRRSHIQQLAHNHWCCYIDGDGVVATIDIPRSLLMSNPVDASTNSSQVLLHDPSPANGMRKTPSFSFLNPSTASEQAASRSQSTDNLMISSSQMSYSSDITPELDMLQSLCEPEAHSSSTTKARSQSTSRASMSSMKGLKRKHESILEEEVEEDNDVSDKTVTDSLLERCKHMRHTPLAVSNSHFDNIDELSREDAKEISDKLLKQSTKRTIAILLPMPSTSQPATASNAEVQSRKSRRKSSSIYADRVVTVERWMIGRIAREANVSERRLGFTHAVHMLNGDDIQDGEVLVSLNLFGYYDVRRHKQYKADKLGMQQDRWVALKALPKK